MVPNCLLLQVHICTWPPFVNHTHTHTHTRARARDDGLNTHDARILKYASDQKKLACRAVQELRKVDLEY